MWLTLLKIGFGIAMILLVIKLLFYGFFIFLYGAERLRRALINFCKARGQSSNPWLFLIWEAIWLNVWFSETATIKTLLPTALLNEIFLYTLIALPFVVLLIKAKLYFLPVLAAKVIRLPLDLIHIVFGFFVNDEDIGDTGTEYATTEYSKNASTRTYTGMPRRTNGSQTNQNRSQNETKTIKWGTSSENGFIDPNQAPKPYVPEKYRDLEYVRNHSDSDTYTYTKVGDQKVYSSGDYAPFIEGSDTPDLVERDSGYAPFDES